MEENKEKKPYNKKRHYYNNRNRRREKPAEEGSAVNLSDETPKEGFKEAVKEAQGDAPKAVHKENHSQRNEKRRKPQRQNSKEGFKENVKEGPVDALPAPAENDAAAIVAPRRERNHGGKGKFNDRRKQRGERRAEAPEAEPISELPAPEQITVGMRSDRFANEGERLTDNIGPIFTDDDVDELPSVDPAELEEMEALADVMLIDGIEDSDLMAEENSSAGSSEDVKYEVVGVKFGSAAKTYYFDPDCKRISVGEGVIVETARGDKYGKCVLTNTYVPEKYVYLPLRKVLRIANEEDATVNEENIKLADAAFKQCNVKIAEHQLQMKLIDAAYTHDRSKLVFFFTAPTRVDFRELVKDLAAIFKTRIDLRQVGIRDEAKMIGGYGVCGRPLCCASFLPNFNQVSIKMAKDQNLTLNINKLSGSCGRLMCCLKYEHQTYLDEAKLMPPIGSYVRTPDGNGTVVELSPVNGIVKVRVSDDKSSMPRPYKKSDVSVLRRAHTASESDGGESDKAD